MFSFCFFVRHANDQCLRWSSTSPSYQSHVGLRRTFSMTEIGDCPDRWGQNPFGRQRQTQHSIVAFGTTLETAHDTTHETNTAAAEQNPRF